MRRFDVMHYAPQPIDSLLIVVVFTHKIRANLSISIFVEMSIRHEVNSSHTVLLLKCESKFLVDVGCFIFDGSNRVESIHGSLNNS